LTLASTISRDGQTTLFGAWCLPKLTVSPLTRSVNPFVRKAMPSKRPLREGKQMVLEEKSAAVITGRRRR
jgi:hypothetical protein